VVVVTRRISLGRLYLNLIREGADVDGCHGDEYDRQVWRALEIFNGGRYGPC
jgi:hypothetical protein